jgi:hypothetical protein
MKIELTEEEIKLMFIVSTHICENVNDIGRGEVTLSINNDTFDELSWLRDKLEKSLKNHHDTKTKI